MGSALVKAEGFWTAAILRRFPMPRRGHPKSGEESPQSKSASRGYGIRAFTQGMTANENALLSAHQPEQRLRAGFGERGIVDRGSPVRRTRDVRAQMRLERVEERRVGGGIVERLAGRADDADRAAAAAARSPGRWRGSPSPRGCGPSSRALVGVRAHQRHLRIVLVEGAAGEFRGHGFRRVRSSPCRGSPARRSPARRGCAAASSRVGPAPRTPPTSSSAHSVVVMSSTPATRPLSMSDSIVRPPVPVA